MSETHDSTSPRATPGQTRSAILRRAMLLDGAKARALARRARRLAKVDPRGAETQAAMRRALLQGIVAESIEKQHDLSLLTIRIPPPSAGKATLAGRVMDEDGAGLPRMTVAVIDARGCTLGYEGTDARGYFRVSVAKPAHPRVEHEKAQGLVGRLTDAIEQVALGPAPSSSVEESRCDRFRLQVSNASGAVLYRDEEPVEVEYGQMRYDEIIVEDPARTGISPPPDGGPPVPSE